VPREEDLARNEQPLPPADTCLLPPVPGLTPTFLEFKPGSEVQTPTEGRAPSGEIGEEPITNEPEVPLVELIVHRRVNRLLWNEDSVPDNPRHT